jgi:glycosyltransferase involved in cell wall biosynthesis
MLPNSLDTQDRASHDEATLPEVDPNLQVHTETVADIPTENLQASVAPLLSFGIPIRNGEQKLPRLLDSLLAQNLSDIEIVISDNDSDDGTAELCQAYVRRDSRVRYHRNPENIGQIDNFNKVLELARGKYFRWIGSDDWLEPDYASRCVEVLEAQEEFVGVTTYQDFTFDNGEYYYREYKGERLDSPLPHIRVRRHLWFMTADFGFMDIIYTMMRRDVLVKTHGVRHVPRMDQVLALEIDLLGPFTHIPACLAHRHRQPFDKIPEQKLLQRYGLDRHTQLEDPLGFRAATVMLSVIWDAPIDTWEKVLCLLPWMRFTFVRSGRISYRRLRSTASQIRRSLFPST